MEGSHRPVMLEASVAALAVNPAGVYLDATFGRGGHSRLILQHLGPEGRLIAIDKDPEAVAFAQEHFAGDARFTIVKGSFARLAEIATAVSGSDRVDGVLLDLGVSSPQLDQAERGFSFLLEGPLDMRMDPTNGQSAATWLAKVEVRELARVLQEYGEERYAVRIAKAIVQARRQAPIRTTRELAEIVARANPSWEKDKHPATRSFQAIRIHLNRELEDLKQALTQVLEVLAPGGRLVVISFHSLEDRIVKRFMREQARGDRFPAGLPVTRDQLRPAMRLLGKPRYPDRRELADNPRARSAVLRVAERLA